MSCPCPMSMSMLHDHAEFMSLLHAHIYAARSCPCGMPIFMLHAHVCAACPCTCYMFMLVLHGLEHAAWTWTCSADMGIQHGHGHASWTWTRITVIPLRNSLLFRATVVINVTFLKTVNKTLMEPLHLKRGFKPMNAWIQANVGGAPYTFFSHFSINPCFF